MKAAFMVIGVVCVALGVLGIALPVLPTTPFLLLAAALFARSSGRLHAWLLGHRVLGKYIQGFLVEKVIPRRIKIISVSMLWAAILASIFTVGIGRWWLQLLLAGVAVGVTVHILSFKTKE